MVEFAQNQNQTVVSGTTVTIQAPQAHPQNSASQVGIIYDLLLVIQNPQTPAIDREKAQNRLKSLANYVIQHARDISEVAEAPNLPLTNPIKQHAVIHLKGHIQRYLKYENSPPSSELFQLADMCTCMLLSKNIQSTLKVHLQDALTALIKADGKAKNNVKVTYGLFEDFIQNRLQISQFDSVVTFNELVQHIGNSDAGGILRVINAYLCGMKSREQTLTLLQGCHRFLTLLMSHDFFNPLLLGIQQLAGLTDQARAQQISQIEQQLELLSTWLKLVLSLLKHFNKGNFVDGLRFFAARPEYAVTLRSAMFLATNSRTSASPEGEVRKQTTLLQHSEATTLVPIGADTRKARKLANQVTQKALHFYKIIWQYLWLLKPPDLFTGTNPYIVDAHYFFPQIIDTLTYLPHVQDLEHELDNADIKLTVIKSMEVLQLFCDEKEFQDNFFINSMRQIYLQVILPYLKITETEKETMDSDAKEFCHAIEDVCGDQKSSTVKVTAAKLLGSLSENVPGFYQQMVIFAIDAIQRSLKEHVPTNLSFTANSTDDFMVENAPIQETTTSQQAQNPEVTLNAHFSDPDLEQIIQKYNLKFDGPEELIEVCLVSIAATSHLLQQQRDIHQLFDQFMFENLEKMLRDKSQDVLVRQRASLLCSFTLDSVYQTFLAPDERNNGLDLILTSLLEQLSSKNKKKVLALQALETLQMTVGDDAFGERVQINFDWVMEKLTEYITTLNLPDFFDYLVTFVQMFHGSFTEDNLSKLLNATVQRILVEHEKLTEVKQPKKTLDLRKNAVKQTKRSSKNFEFRIAKLWSVMRYVAEHEHFTDRMVPVIETCSLPLLKFMQDPESVNFDDDLIFFISSLLKKAKSTNSAILREAFQFLPKFLAKFNYIFGPLIECICLYTMYSRVNDQNYDWIANSQENLQLLFDMCKAAFAPPTPQASPLDGGVGGPCYTIEGALVLQAIFQNLNGAQLLDYLIGPTVDLVYGQLCQQRVTVTLKRHLMLTVLACVLQNPTVTLGAIHQRGHTELEGFFSQFAQSSADPNSALGHKSMRSAYELKLFSVALTNVAFYQPEPNSQTPADALQQLQTLLPRPALLRQVVLALTRQQRTQQKQLARTAQKADKKNKKAKKAKDRRMKGTMVSQMVDNILRDAHEVGFSSGDDGDLSGDEVRQPLFLIKREMEAEESKDLMVDDEDVDSEAENDMFVQDEYDLANNVDQMATRLDSFDEYRHMRTKVTQCHQANASFLQLMINQALTTPKQRDYLKQIMQSQRVMLDGGDQADSSGGTSSSQSCSQDAEFVPRRIVRVRRKQ